MSPLLETISSRIAAATGVEAACLRAELAAHLGRSGCDVKDELTFLRLLNASHCDPRLSAWIHIAEGVLDLTQGRADSGVGRLERARAVANAVGLVREISVVDSWLAYHSYTRNDIISMIERVRSVLIMAEHADKNAIGRAQMLIGQSFHLAGDFGSARSWYDSTKAIASETGDHGLRSALLFNIASHHVCNYRHYVLRGSPSSMPLDLLEVVADSVRNYDELVGITSLSSYESTLSASVHLFHQRFAEAFALFHEFVESALSAGLRRMASLYLAEMAYCAVSLSDHGLATKLSDKASTSVDSQVHIDDRAATHSRLAQVYDMLGDLSAAEGFRTIGVNEWREHEEFQKKILSNLAIGLNGLNVIG